MENVYNFNMTELLAFALVLLRMLGFVVAMPVIGTANIPAQIKILFALTMSFVLFPQVGWQKLTTDIESIAIVTLAIKEVFVGLAFGFIARLFFMAVLMAGQIMSVTLGLSAAQLFNPGVGEVSTAFDQFYMVLATLFFFAILGHHSLISGIFQTFEIVPIQKTSISLLGSSSLAGMTSMVMALAVKMSAPIIIAILFMNVAVAVVGRAVPQINILITSLPINILAGFFVMFIALPLMVWQMSDLLSTTTEELMKYVKTL